MTKLFYSSTTRVATSESAILLKACHRLLSETSIPSFSSRNIAELYDEIDILHISPINFTITGTYNGRPISHDELLDSMALEIILDYIRKVRQSLHPFSILITLAHTHRILENLEYHPYQCHILTKLKTSSNVKPWFEPF
jgi:hypothetical protein